MQNDIISVDQIIGKSIKSFDLCDDEIDGSYCIDVTFSNDQRVSICAEDSQFQECSCELIDFPENYQKLINEQITDIRISYENQNNSRGFPTIVVSTVLIKTFKDDFNFVFRSENYHPSRVVIKRI